MKKTFLLLALSSVAFIGLAQEDVYVCQFYGFSDDMKYCAFETYQEGEPDGPINSSKIYFIDVDKNDYAVKPVFRTADETNSVKGESNRTANRKAADIYFKQFNIRGGKLGTSVLMAIDTENYKKPALPDQEFAVGSDKYVVHLSVVDTGESDDNFHTKAMFEVSLEKSGQGRILQKAVPTPKSWGFVYNYELKSIFYLNGRIAVFVEYHTPGFEGEPNRNQMIVTGRL